MSERRGVSSGADGDGETAARSRDRAVSATVNYVLALGITAILVSGLLIAGSGYMESQRSIAVGDSLEVQNEKLADSIGDVDRLAAAMDNESGEAAIRVDLPSRVIDRSYRIAVTNQTAVDDRRHTYRLESSSGDIARSTTVRTTLPIEETSIRGGSIVVRYETVGGEPALVLESSEQLG